MGRVRETEWFDAVAEVTLLYHITLSRRSLPQAQGSHGGAGNIFINSVTGLVTTPEVWITRTLGAVGGSPQGSAASAVPRAG